MEPQFFQIKTIPAALWGFPSERVIVAVHGAHIGEAHVLKQGASGEQAPFQKGFHLMIETVKGIFHRLGAKETPVPLLEMIVPGPGPEPGQVGGHSPHIGVDGHAVVV